MLASRTARLLHRLQCQTPGDASAALTDGKGGGAERIGRLALCPFKAVLLSMLGREFDVPYYTLYCIVVPERRTTAAIAATAFLPRTGSNRNICNRFLESGSNTVPHTTRHLKKANTAPQQPCTHAPLTGHTLLCDGRPDHHEVRSSPATLWPRPRGRPEEGEQHRQPEQPQWRLGQHQCAVADALPPGPSRDSP